MSLMGLLSLFVGGCSHPADQLAPGDHVFVNITQLSQQRPEWQGVQQLDAQIARLRALLLRAVAMSPARAANIPPSNLAQAPGAVVQAATTDANALEAAVAASTPTPEEIQAELEKEAEGEQRLFERNTRRALNAEEQNRERGVESGSIDERIGIIHQFESTVVNLWLKEGVLQDLADKLRPSLYGPPPASVRYTQIQDQLAALYKILSDASNPDLQKLRAAGKTLPVKLDALRGTISPSITAILQFQVKVEIVGSELSDLQHEQASALRIGGAPLKSKLAALIAAMDSAIASATPVQQRLSDTRDRLLTVHELGRNVLGEKGTPLHERIDELINSVEATSAATTEMEEQLIVVRSVLYHLLEQQSRALEDVESGLQEAINALQREVAARIAAAIAKHRQATENRIWQQVLGAEQDIEEEARQRNALFAHSFKNPLQPTLAMNAGAATSVTLPTPQPGNASPFQDALLRELADLQAQRSRLAASLLRDTESWAAAIAVRRKLVAAFSPA
ncbi:MAG: hypothetical protein M3Y56_02895, partial [Armatimonadota bacterium]|nr:hypothetical protein [Armatimonadota bacterium]